MDTDRYCRGVIYNALNLILKYPIFPIKSGLSHRIAPTKDKKHIFKYINYS